MSAYRMISCDGANGDCPEELTEEATIAGIRRELIKRGWQVVKATGEDFCPHHRPDEATP